MANRHNPREHDSMQAARRDGTRPPVAVADPVRSPAGTQPAPPGGGFSQPRRHTVTAVVVVHNGMPWLPRTLAAIESLTRRPDRLIAVDTGSDDGSAAQLAACPLVDEVLPLPASTTFGAAVAAAQAARSAEPEGDAPSTEWLWLLHDDCAPAPSALAELLDQVDRDPGAAVLGPKVRGWHDGGLLLECGLAITNSGRRFTGLETGDRDQGQADDRSEVLAVGSAGMLVRREVWRRLGGFDPGLAMYGDDVEFCMRARRADERVLVVPSAVVHHREAALHGVRRTDAFDAPASLAGRSSSLYTALVHGPMLMLPLTSVFLLLRTLINAVLLLIGAGPSRAWAEMKVWGRVHLHPIRVIRARRRLRSVATVPRRDLHDLRPSLREQWGLGIERAFLGLRARLRPARRGTPLDLAAALAVAGVLAVIAAAATRAVWTAQGPLLGGALLQPTDGSSLWAGFRMAWHDVGLGSSEPAAAYPLALALLASPPAVSVDAVVSALLLFTVPLSALSAFFALRGLPHRAPRAGLAIAYGLTPAVVAPSLDGRLGTAAVAIVLPGLIRLLLRMLAGPAAPDCLPPPRLRTAAAAAALLTVCAAFAPLVWVAVAVVAVAGAVLHLRTAAGWSGVGLLLVMPVILLWPWSGALIADPSRVMFEAGVSSPQLVAPTPPGWRLLLLDPGTLTPAGSGIGSLGSGALFVAAPLVLAAAAALLWRGSRGVALWGWVVVLVGLIGATVQTTQKFVPVGATTAQYGFAGPMVIVMAGGMVLAVAAALLAISPPTKLGRRFVSAGMLAALVAGPVVLAVAWTTEFTGPLRRSDETAIPAFVAAEAQSPDRIRTLLLEAGPGGAVAFNLVNGAGGRLGDADVAPPAQTWRQISAAAGALAAGVGSQPVEVLAGNAVRYIVADTRDTALTGALDGNSALRRVSTTDGRGLWRVSGLTTRARVVSEAGEDAVGVATPAQTVSSRGTILDTEVHSPAAGSVLSIAQTDDGQWTATVDGVRAVVAGQGRTVLQLPESGTVPVVVAHDQQARDTALLIPLAAAVLLGVLLLPRGVLAREGTDPDSSADEGGTHPSSPAAGPGATVDITDTALAKVQP